VRDHSPVLVRPTVVIWFLAAGSAVVLATVLLVLGDPEDSGATAACEPALRRGAIPAWARAGFSAPEPRMPHAVGRDGEIAAIVFGDPLQSPPPRDRSNKILWVAREPLDGPADLRISAQRMDGARTVGSPVQRVVDGGPGPSIVDLPAAGCWRLALRWAGREDAVDLAYAPR
jgi:hypothetical protein